ncbi:radical SAM protein [Desulfuromonas sp. AOP6]|uniref:radical SAM protein n=1 Tax=Desulfuromonas sp. AOP6 TaxID=1566351 RepID=UPI00128459E2|nr:radical SAM protein [Desulfuromonas sp. AOP6]BCA80518.1 radical SAM protein [Desulfuromonas sp. AOP6]
MSRLLISRMKNRLERERGSQAKPWGGRLTIALVFPNTYFQAMSNLGFQTVYHLLNSRDDVLCERFFLPDPVDLKEHEKTGTALFSLESQRPLADFDVVAFSISFENDYVQLPTLFRLGRIPFYAAERGDSHPLVLCGGVCAFLNPEPLADIMDLFAVGEGEVLLPSLLEQLTTLELSRPELLAALAGVAGVYVPSLYDVRYAEDGTLAAMMPQKGAPPQVRRQWVRELDNSESRTFVHTPDTAFADMSLVEISRGCSRGCRFCAAGFIYLPARERTLQALLPQVEQGLCMHRKIGLVGAAVSDYSDIDDLNREIFERQGLVSVASLRMDSLTAEEVDALRESGHRTLALAPEAGSQRLRDLINKGIDEGQILSAARLLAAGGILNLKLYFLIGLPTEEQDDIDELLQLTAKVREVWVEEQKKSGRLGTLTLSVNPFIPKPFTPLQWAAMDGAKVLESKMKHIRAGIARMPNCEVIFESMRSALLQAFLSRGDRRMSAALPLLAKGMNLKAACREVDLDPDFYVTRERGESELFPWEIIDNGVRRDYLWSEYGRAVRGQLTPPCFPGCRRCGVCV